MNISLEKSSNVSAVITLKMVKSDYEENVKKTLKTYSQKAQIPGFRPGKVPVGLVKKMYGTQAKAEEVNKLLGEKLYDYIKENQINMLGEPLPSESQPMQDIENQDDFEFVFDIALAPEFTAELSAADSVVYYDIEVSEAQIDEQVQQIAQRGGHPEKVETYADRDIVRGVLAELDEQGMPKEGGVVIEAASLMPTYFKNNDQKAIFENTKVNDVVTFNPSKAYENSQAEIAALLKVTKEEAAQYVGEFSFQIEEISRFVPAELNQEFFDQVFGNDVVSSLDEFRVKVKENIMNQHSSESDYRFLLDVRTYLENKVGALEFPNELLKRIMLANNKDKGADYVEEHFDKSIEELKWHLIKEQLVKANDVKIDDNDLKETAKQATRFQFAQYGMANIPEEYIEQYAAEMLKNREQVNGLLERCIENKLIAVLKNVVTLDHKNISVEDFGKLFA